jgi:GDSL-like Lipase/Acylhydrolase family
MRRRLFLLMAVSIPSALVAALVIAAGVEVWTRLRWNPLKGTPGFFLSDPVRRQRLAPGYSGWFAGVPVKINSLGLHDDREYRLVKGPNTIRLLVLGDSVAFGHGSVYEHTYPYLLEQRLRAWRPDVDWEVWNAAVPGYNTSQELAHLLEFGPVSQPDLVVIAFFENDIADNYQIAAPTAASRIRSAILSSLYRHVYSIQLYKRAYLQIAWRWSASNSYRLRLEHVAEETQLTANLPQVADLEDQKLTEFERLSDDQVRAVRCNDGSPVRGDVVGAVQREPGFDAWMTAVRRLQRLGHDGVYPLMFFVNVAPMSCASPDVFYDGGTADLNRFYLRVLGDGTPAVSAYDAFRHVRPSQMPSAAGHALGNSNVVKTDVLFSFLRDELFPRTRAGRTAAILHRAPPSPERGGRTRS